MRASTRTLLFPNALDAGNEIRAGETIALPRPRWQLTAGGPPGIDKLLVLVTEGPRDLPAVRGNQAGVAAFAHRVVARQGIGDRPAGDREAQGRVGGRTRQGQFRVTWVVWPQRVQQQQMPARGCAQPAHQIKISFAFHVKAAPPTPAPPG